MGRRRDGAPRASASPPRVQVDKVMTVPREKVGPRLGAIDEGTMQRVDEALRRFLGLGWEMTRAR